MTDTRLRIIVGAIAAGAVAVVGYLALPSVAVLTPEIATALSALIAGVAGYIVPKAPA